MYFWLVLQMFLCFGDPWSHIIWFDALNNILKYLTFFLRVDLTEHQSWMRETHSGLDTWSLLMLSKFATYRVSTALVFLLIWFHLVSSSHLLKFSDKNYILHLVMRLKSSEPLSYLPSLQNTTAWSWRILIQSSWDFSVFPNDLHIA